MKKRIDGVVYDTANAIKVATRESDLPKWDFDWYEETLYKTKRTNRYFIHGIGGAATVWQHRCEDGSRPLLDKLE